MRRRQEIFDIAYTGLAAQGFVRSMNGEGCAYRGENGMKCAIGFLISDEKYSAALEGLTPFDEGVRRAALLGDEDVDFAVRLQGAHDGERGEDGKPEYMRRRLHAFAIKNDLTIPQVAA